MTRTTAPDDALHVGDVLELVSDEDPQVGDVKRCACAPFASIIGADGERRPGRFRIRTLAPSIQLESISDDSADAMRNTGRVTVRLISRSTH